MDAAPHLPNMHMRPLNFAAVLLASFVATLGVADEPRSLRGWQLPNGGQEPLRLVRVMEKEVELQSATGELHVVPLAELGDEDRRYVVEEVQLLWAHIVLDAEVITPLTAQTIELFGSAASGGEGPFAQGVTPMQMGGQTGLTPARLAEKYGVPLRRTMEVGEEKGVEYIVYGPIAVGASPSDERVTWVRIDRKLAADGLKKSAAAALGIAVQPSPTP
jgi:hypothetical protein